MFRPHHVEDRRSQIRVAHYGSAFDLATVDDNATDAIGSNQNLSNIATDPSVDPILG